MRFSFRTWLVLGLIVLVALGCRRSARGPLTYQEQVALARKDTDPESRAKKLIRLGYQMGLAKDRVGAEETLRSVWEDCDAVSKPQPRAEAFALLAEAYGRLNNRQQSLRAVAQAKTAAEQVESAESRVTLLSRIAKVQALSDSPAATALLKQTEEFAQQAEMDAVGKVIALCTVAGTYHELKNSAERDRLLELLSKMIESIEEPSRRYLAWCEMAVCENAVKKDAAQKTFQSALDTAQKIKDEYGRAYALSEIARKLASAGFGGEARKVLKQAEAEAEKITQPDLQLQALERIRKLLSEL